CVTPLSNFEVTQGYKDVKDISVTVKFKIQNSLSPKELSLGDKPQINSKFKIPNNEPVYILAWTTTPWTLPGNVLLAVNKDIGYSVIKLTTNNEQLTNEYLVMAKERVEEVLKDKEYSKIGEMKGSDLVGLEYEPLFPYFANTPNAFRVVAGDFVSTTDGTGVVHIAPAFGEDDYNVGKREGVPMVQHVSMEGRFIEEVEDFAGHEVKPKEDPTATDVEIIKWLAGNGKLFAKEKFEHSYPHCWRCDTPLLNYATSSWFVRVTELKDHLLKNNEEINWVPEHIKEGRFGQWLEGARDWAISRSRYWGTPLPVWESEDGEHVCVGSVEELESLTGQKVEDLHKHKIDDLEIKKDGKIYRRVPDVLDCWFESGSMPYGQMHYPFENKKKFENSFPAKFIAEGQDQTRGWFYTLHVLATALTMGKKPSIPCKHSEPAFKNVIVNGIVLAEDGKKMSKRLKNYPEPEIILEKYGADAVRYYLITSPVMEAESLNFSEAGVREVYNKVINTLWNVVIFYEMYGVKKSEIQNLKFQKLGVLDRWILAKLQVLVKEATEGMVAYSLPSASRPILDFVTELSQWYVRRSRDRFKGENIEDHAVATAVLREVLLTLSKIMAPFTPFVAEKIYLQLTVNNEQLTNGKESVHLEDWPEVGKKWVDEEVLKQMAAARKIVEMGLALRAEKGIRVRQPLGKFLIFNFQFSISDELLRIIADEINVKKVEVVGDAGDAENMVMKEEGDLKVGLDVDITEELKKEGLAREIVRTINQMRKEQKLTVSDMVKIAYKTEDVLLQNALSQYAEEIMKSVAAVELEAGEGGVEKEIEGAKIWLNIAR
ncbi:isoleucine--tRNA ligase, partial [Patescibacteria group bacterium]|nr:isoleucine--tRNA ligase [Patescibacteria group bacterium]